MDSIVKFTYRNKISTCTIYIDNSEDPCLIFAILSDKELVNEFGEDVSIKTDCVNLLPKGDDYPELRSLRQAIFDVAKNTAEFIALTNGNTVSKKEKNRQINF